MPPKKLDRDAFFAKLAALDESQLKKALWNLYWRGAAPVRARIEAEIDPAEQQRAVRASRQPVNGDDVLADVEDFVGLVRSGAYFAGDRRVSPRERSRWRFTFQRLANDTRSALRNRDISAAAEAMELLIDLACELRDYHYVHSDDPVEAARFVVSDAAALLWGRIRDQDGFTAFTERAAAQLIRWESPFGWTSFGFGQVSEKESSLAHVLDGMLRLPDAWVSFADCYLRALDDAVRGGQRTKRLRHGRSRSPDGRTADLAQWHQLLLTNLIDSEAEDRLDRLIAHPALAGPELDYFRARLAHRRGDTTEARRLVRNSLQRLPGHQDFLSFAAEIDAPLPPNAQRVRDQRGF